MKKSNWREELNAPNAVKKYALDEIALTATLGGIALWKLLGGAAVVGGVGAAYDYDQKMKGKKGIFPDFTKMFNRGKTIDTLSQDDNFWRDNSKTKETDIPDGIGKDIVNPGELKPEVTKKNTEVGQVGDGTAVGGQTVAPTISRAISKAGAISQADVNKAKKTPFKSFRLGKPKIGTGHNVGRRVNPQ